MPIALILNIFIITLKMKISAMSLQIKDMTQMQSEIALKHLDKSPLFPIERIERSKKLSIACYTRLEILSREFLEESKSLEG